MKKATTYNQNTARAPVVAVVEDTPHSSHQSNYDLATGCAAHTPDGHRSPHSEGISLRGHAKGSAAELRSATKAAGQLFRVYQRGDHKPGRALCSLESCCADQSCSGAVVPSLAGVLALPSTSLPELVNSPSDRNFLSLAKHQRQQR